MGYLGGLGNGNTPIHTSNTRDFGYFLAPKRFNMVFSLAICDISPFCPYMGRFLQFLKLSGGPKI